MPRGARVTSENGSMLPGLRKHTSVSHDRLASEEDDLRGEDDRNSDVERLYEQTEGSRQLPGERSALAAVLDTSDLMTDAAAALIDDSFFRCFTSAPPDPWNWNGYLLPVWCLGCFARYCILFPLRLLFLITSQLLFFAAFFPIQAVLKDSPRRRSIERELVRWSACAWVASWSGVLKFHGPHPRPAPGRVWVANHSSMIDYTLLTALMPFAAIMQLQPGWVGFLQRRVLNCLGCLWFHRTEAKDRNIVHKRMYEHVHAPDATPLLIFPEGTCVNNEYTVMFKRGAFDLDATVCPIAIKFNKIFVDAFWNSKRQPFTTYIFKIMTSWALVADIYFLPPQTIQKGETSVEFANRVQAMIAEVAQLRIVPWDGYLKYYNLAQKRPQLVEARRRTIAKRLLSSLGLPPPASLATQEET